MAKLEPEKRYYLESNALIDFIEHPETEEPARTIKLILEDASAGRFEVFTSVLTIAEVWTAKVELDKKCLDPDVERKLNLLWHPQSSPIQLIEVHELIARDAMRLLRSFVHKGYAKTKPVDAIHLVTAQRAGVHKFFTSEASAKKWDKICGFEVCRPHYEPKGGPDLFTAPSSTLEESSSSTQDGDWLVRMSKNRHLLARDPNRFGSQRSLNRNT